jgi:hypothetical protein
MASVCAVVTDSLGLLSAVEAHAHVDHFVAMSRKTPKRKAKCYLRSIFSYFGLTPKKSRRMSAAAQKKIAAA